jgi:hypothetical protein
MGDCPPWFALPIGGRDGCGAPTRENSPMKRSLVIPFACLVLAGCGHRAELMTPKTEQTCRNPNQCEIRIVNPTCSLSGCTAAVDFELTRLERQKNNIRVTWKLPPGYGFCDTAGDGVFLKETDPYAQFEVIGAGRAEGSARCNRTEFELRAKNTKSLPNEPYTYKVVFHDAAGGKLFVIDPLIMND